MAAFAALILTVLFPDALGLFRPLFLSLVALCFLLGLALLILFTTVLAPALRILGLLYVVFPLSFGRVPPGVAGAMRFQEALVSWAMLDVYMLALLVILVIAIAYTPGYARIVEAYADDSEARRES